MKQASRRFELVGVGLAAASFAALLAVASLDRPDQDAERAALAFAVSLPLYLFGVLLMDCEGTRVFYIDRFDRFASGLGYWCWFAGTIGCLTGLYFIFDRVSHRAGQWYAATTVVAVAGLVFLRLSAALLLPLRDVLIWLWPHSVRATAALWSGAKRYRFTRRVAASIERGWVSFNKGWHEARK